MNTCKTCGHVFEGLGRINVCPACAIGHVLDGDLDYIHEPFDLPKVNRSPLVGRLLIREDFFAKYQITAAVDDGGQGRVWKVWDYEFRRELAMKGLSEELASSPSACYRFLAEAQITSQLKHPGILPVYDLGLDLEGKPYYTTDLCNGVRLDKYFAQLKQQAWTKPTLNAALTAIVRVCEIMGHVHSRGVIHRDLKPANILVGEFGDVRVIDWGSAAILKKADTAIEKVLIPNAPSGVQTDRQQIISESPNLATAVEGWPSTPIYTAPELLAGRVEEIGPETDIYSIGVILYELLTGQLPYIVKDRGISAAEVKRRILTTEAIRVRLLTRGPSRDLAAITERAMARDRNARYRSMQDLAADIRAAIELRPVQARKPTLLLETQRLIQRHPSQTISIALVIFAFAVSYFVVQGFQADRKADRQVKAWESAVLAERNGRWREALQHFNEAEAAGYGDLVSLGLNRAEAWRALNDPNRAMAELERLGDPSGKYRGVVMLRKAEIEICDAEHKDEVILLAAKSLAVGLPLADQAFAEGLLAPSTSEALSHFRQALILDPYHHGAHIHLLGIEFLLGLHQELQNEMQIFKTLYPDDPSPVYIQAFEYALNGQLKEADKTLNAIKEQSSSDVFRQLQAGCQITAAMAASLEPDAVMDFLRTNKNRDLIELMPVPQSAGLNRPADLVYPVRMPQLPCITQGLANGLTGVRSLSLGLLSEPSEATRMIKAAHDIYPEALAPLLGGIILDKTIARAGAESLRLRMLQADLFELAANSSSMFPKAPMLARYLAARSEFAVAMDSQSETNAAREACINYIEHACFTRTCSENELSDYFEFTFGLKDYDLARLLLVEWTRVAPGSPSIRRDQIDLDIACGALDEAQRQLGQMLDHNPADSWALNRKAIVVQNLRKLTAPIR